MEEKLYDSEAKVMQILWEKGAISAKEISLIAADTIGWNKNTTYTIIKKLEAKGFIRRDDPGFICTPLVSKEQVQEFELNQLVEKTFEGSLPAFIAAFTKHQKISDAEIDAVQEMIDRFRKGESK